MACLFLVRSTSGWVRPGEHPDLQIADSSFANAVSFFIHAHNETLSVVAMRARDEDCSLLGIDS